MVGRERNQILEKLVFMRLSEFHNHLNVIMNERRWMK